MTTKTDLQGDQARGEISWQKFHDEEAWMSWYIGLLSGHLGWCLKVNGMCCPPVTSGLFLIDGGPKEPTARIEGIAESESHDALKCIKNVKISFAHYRDP